jgi:O-antigen ligase
MKKIKLNNLLFIKIPSVLTCSIPALLITGPFLPDLAVSLCALIFLINTFKNKLYSFYTNYFVYFFIAFCVWILFCSLLSKNVLLSFESSLFYFRFGLFTLSTWFLLNNNNRFIYYTFYVILFCFVILILDGFYQFFNNQNIFGFPLISNRISSFFNDEWILGSYLSRFYPILFAFFLFINKKKNNFTNNFTIGLILVGAEIIIFLSGERSSFFFLNFGAIYLILQMKYYKFFRSVLLVIALCLIVFISYYSPEYKNRMIDVTAKQLQKTVDKSTGEIEIFSSQHQVVYASAFRIFLDNKFTGIGPKNFRVICKDPKYFIIDYKTTKHFKSSCETHPHNSYLQLLTETGIPGFAFIFLLLLIVVYVSIKHFFYKHLKNNYIFNDYQLCLIAAIFISIWPIVPSGNFFNNWLSIIYYFPVGFFLHSLQINYKL